MLFSKKSYGVFISSILSTYVLAASHNPQQFLDSIKGLPNEGAQIVEHFCATCHAAKPMIELGAPTSKNSQNWNNRAQQGLDVLLLHTLEGFGAMPARGGCFECSDAQLQEAILFMLPESAKKFINKTNR